MSENCYPLQDETTSSYSVAIRTLVENSLDLVLDNRILYWLSFQR
jgi:hypothetical protein